MNLEFQVVSAWAIGFFTAGNWRNTIMSFV